VPLAGGPQTRLTSAPAVETTLVVSRADDKLAYIRSDPANLPDLWVQAPHPGAPAQQLTRSMSPALRAFRWQTPRIVSYTTNDGLPIRAQLFTPQPLDPKAKYPAIVHVHQAAIYQEVFLGSGPHKDNLGWYGWHQRMASRGFVVLNVDYRGSYGYGRDFRTANHLDVGVGDAADVVQGVDYLKGLGYVDPGRIGVYGMSYGGHLVLTLLAKYPDTFQAGVNIAGVFDYLLETGPWDMRNSWMYARLGTPEQNPEPYRNASASNFIHALKSPLLTLHGTADMHVTPLQSFRLNDELLKRGKRFDMAWYPGEVHFFSRRSSWLDAFRRMERFFDEWLGAPTPGPNLIGR
jgi:dipeptidyl aminopeptidase/acylaminoacyl peptidase